MAQPQQGLSREQGADRPRVRRVFSYPLILILCLAGAVGLILLIDLYLPDSVGVILLDRDRSTYPFTVQNLMWIVFALGIGELVVRARDAAAERAQLKMGYLPEDETTLLQSLELRHIYAVARRANQPDAPSEGRFLPRLIQRIVTQFQTTRSIDQSNAILNSSLELYLHEIDLRYTMIRYVVWAIPTLGFIGTVVGISLALAFAGSVDLQDPSLARGTHQAPGGGLQHDLAGAGHVGVPGADPAYRPGLRGTLGQPGRAVLPRQPDQPACTETDPPCLPVRVKPWRS